MNAPYALRWCRRLPHGTCAAISMPDARSTVDESLPDALSAGERAYATTLKSLRRVSWVGGRVALRHAARSLAWDLDTVSSTARGAPALPEGLIGSIAHKSRIAVALVDESTTDTIGVDLEELDRPRPKISRLVLRPEEQAVVAELLDDARWQAIVLRFSIKEAIFKALDPYVQRYIGFQEASVEPRDDGTAAITLRMTDGEGPFFVDGWWTIADGHVIATVRARLL